MAYRNFSICCLYYVEIIAVVNWTYDVHFSASIEEAEQDVDLLEVKLEKVIIFCNWTQM